MITDLPVASSALLTAVEWSPGTPLASGGRPDLIRVRCGVDDLAELVAVLPARGPRVRLELTPGSWPVVVDVAALVGGGVVECSVQSVERLTGAEWVRFVAFLVAAREHGLEPQWTLPRLRPDWVGAELLNHLSPPAPSDTLDADTVADLRSWAAAYRFGALYWRRGPGFASVVDSRGEDTARYLIDEPDLLALFTTLAHPVAVAALEPAGATGLADLVEAGLVVVDDGWAVRLPYRLTHRPMPGNQV